MMYIQFCITDGSDSRLGIWYEEYKKEDWESVRQDFRKLVNEFFDTYNLVAVFTDDEYDDYWNQIWNNSYFCQVTKEMYEEGID